VQYNPTWTLDRIDQRDLPLDHMYNYSNTALGINIFILDTGIMATHVDFGGRVVQGWSTLSGTTNTSDCGYGHGTHVASTAGGITYGVAKNATLVPVQVLSCTNNTGTTGQLIAGLDWVVANYAPPGVISLALSTAYSASVNAAVANAVAAGFTATTAAGNDYADACNYSPASEPTVLTASASVSDDNIDSNANFGSCVSLFAPGVGVLGACLSSNTCADYFTGTSFAPPTSPAPPPCTWTRTPLRPRRR